MFRSEEFWDSVVEVNRLVKEKIDEEEKKEATSIESQPDDDSIEETIEDDLSKSEL